MGGKGLSVIGQGGSGFDPSWGDKKKPKEGGKGGKSGIYFLLSKGRPKYASFVIFKNILLGAKGGLKLRISGVGWVSLRAKKDFLPSFGGQGERLP